MNLIGVALDAPVIGVLKRWPNRIHAIEMNAVVKGWERGTFVSACGVKGLRFWGVEEQGTMIAAPFPPRIKGMPEEMERCRDCWIATGKKRPRTQWKAR